MDRPRTCDPMSDYRLVRDIEERSGRVVSIETELTEENLAKCILQYRSPLFRLPAEVRNIIFWYTCQPYDSEKPPLNENIYYHRPERRVRKTTSTALLRTCRRAWLEANHLPLEMGDNRFWLTESDRRTKAPIGRRPADEDRLESFLNTLTIKNRIDLKHIHIYAHMMLLESGEPTCIQRINATGACPEIFTLTIRYSDWWSWEYGNGLRLDDKWLENVLKWPALPRLREIRLELEVPELQLSQLQSIETHLRNKFTVVQRTDHFGTPATLLIDDLTNLLPMRRWTGMAPARGSHMRGEEVLTSFVVKTFVWTVNREALDGSFPAMERFASSQSRHNPGPGLPVLSVEWSGPASDVPSHSEIEKELPSRIEQKWREQGSLLEFEEDVYSQD